MMLFKTKPTLYIQLLDSSIRYMAVHPSNHTIIEQDELLFEGNILEDGEIANPALLETRLSALIQEKKWKNAKVTMLVLNEFVTIREIEVPNQLEESEIRDYLAIHMNESIRMPFENPSFEYIISGEDEEKGMKNLILIAYPGNKIRQYQDILQKISLKPDVAEVASLSLYRVADKQSLIQKGAEQHTMILQWSPTDVSYTVFNQERPIFKRHTQQAMLAQSFERTAEGEWNWRGSDGELEIHLDEQLNNLSRFLDFYRYSVLEGEGSVSNIILTGSYPDLESLKARISEALNLDVQLLNLPADIPQSYSALYGLTLRSSTKTNGDKKKEMINVNFFEKKKLNVLPYIIGGIFFLFLLLMGAYFFVTRAFYENKIDEKQTWLSDNVESVVLSRQISQLDRLATESDTVQETLQANQYPMDEIIVDIVSVIPNETERIQSFHLSNPNQIVLRLEDTQSTMAQTIVEDLLEKDYVIGVQFLQAENSTIEDTQFRFEMIIDIDANNLLEEDTE